MNRKDNTDLKYKLLKEKDKYLDSNSRIREQLLKFEEGLYWIELRKTEIGRKILEEKIISYERDIALNNKMIETIDKQLQSLV